MTMLHRIEKDIIILYPEGKIVLGDGDQELGEAVRRFLEQGARKLILNFCKVSYLDSSGVGELVGQLLEALPGGNTMIRVLTRLLRLTRHARPARFAQGYLLVSIGEKPQRP
jgi:anti-anti-sigma regulatory factor